MTQTRIYLPLTVAGLDELATRRQVGPAPVTAYTVTDALAAAMPTADEEEREYAALCDAVDDAGAQRAMAGDRRVVAAADVDDSEVADPTDEGHTKDREVPLSRAAASVPVPLTRIVSFHVDDDGGNDDDELLWYDATELEELRRIARS